MTGIGVLRPVAAVASLLACSAVAGTGSSTPAPNLRDPAVVAAGRKLFEERQCATCHGSDGNGGVKLAGLGDLDPADVFATIADGRVEGNLRMPAWRGVLSDKEIWEATAYVLVLAHSSR
ncbi:MAG: cytochrome c [Alphaproteobacteria bacterium]|nr:cytochrome c [Alphaproteobacteria bacterium]